MTDKKNSPEAKLLYRGSHLVLYEKDGWEFAHRPNARSVVAVVALTPGGKLLLVEQYRKPLGKRVIELPAGLAGDVHGKESEESAAAARRELLEETGYRCEKLEYLCEGPSSAGMSTEMIEIYRAVGLEKVAAGGGDSSEKITVLEVPLDEVSDWLSGPYCSGKAIDLKIYAALYLLNH